MTGETVGERRQLGRDAYTRVREVQVSLGTALFPRTNKQEHIFHEHLIKSTRALFFSYSVFGLGSDPVQNLLTQHGPWVILRCCFVWLRAGVDCILFGYKEGVCHSVLGQNLIKIQIVSCAQDEMQKNLLLHYSRTGTVARNLIVSDIVPPALATRHHRPDNQE